MPAMQHVVLIRLPERPGEADQAELARLVDALPASIPGIRRLHWGWDVSGRSRGYQLGLVMEFESAEALAAYLPHPVHQRVVAWLNAHQGEILAFDFPLPG
ncbi:MAG: Dabb family protein [Firmicutes bacterium]|nr:Dabb family protein [Bacillota bacterium]